MPQVLMMEKAAQRAEPLIAQANLEVEIVTWSPEAGLCQGANPVEAQAIAPVAGWISADVFAAGCMREFGDVLKAQGSMRWVQTANAGLDHPIYPALAQQGVRITKSGSQSIPIAEFVLAHALGYYQQLGARREAQDRREWWPHRFRELWRTHWLIVGYGHIGQGVAKRAKGFDCDVTVIRRRPDADAYADRIAPLEQIGEHLPNADFVVLACPATEQTEGMANAEFFARMKPGAVLVNVARGSLVDEGALVAALDHGPLEHAILDVFQTEPLPQDHPLWSHASVTIAAHTSNAGNGTRPRGDELFVSNLALFLAGEPLFDEVPSESN